MEVTWACHPQNRPIDQINFSSISLYHNTIYLEFKVPTLESFWSCILCLGLKTERQYTSISLEEMTPLEGRCYGYRISPKLLSLLIPLKLELARVPFFIPLLAFFCPFWLLPPSSFPSHLIPLPSPLTFPVLPTFNPPYSPASSKTKPLSHFSSTFLLPIPHSSFSSQSPY